MDVAEYETATPRVVAVGEAVGEWARAELSGECTVDAADGSDAVAAAVEDGAVDCVLVGTDASDDGLATVRAVRSADADLPIVYAPATADEGDPVAATAAGATRYLPRDADEGPSLAATVEVIVETFDRRRQRRRERSMFHTFLETTPYSVYFKDADARIVGASTTATKSVDERMIGKTDVEVFRETIGEDAARETYEDDLAVVESGEPILEKEERHLLSGDEPLWLLTSKFPWRTDDGEIVGLYGESRDITAEKEREHQLEHEKRRLEQFASFASHDLRTPLTVATGYLERASETGETEFVEKAQAAIERMERLVDDLLDIVAGDVGEGETEWTDLAAVVRRAWAAVEAPESTLTVEVPDDVEIMAVSGGLRQLLENVLSNAVEHGSTSPRSSSTREDEVDHGGADVTVVVGLTETGFYVADDGPGIPEDEREQVFEHGFTTGGTGVGLALAAEVADAHGWEPRAVESEHGGARIEFNRGVRRSADRPAPAEGESIALDGPTVVGDVPVEGTAGRGEDGHDWTLSGGGRALWGGMEEYTAAHGTAEGDCRVEARLTNLDRVHGYSKAGVFVADAAELDRPLGFAGATAENGHETAWRAEAGDPVETVKIDDGDVLPRWYRIDVFDDRVTCYASTDGEEWTVLDQNVLDVDGDVVVGILVNSHERGTPCEAAFETVRAVGLAVPDADEAGSDSVVADT